MMRRLFHILLLCGTVGQVFLALPSLAYEKETHKEMSRRAAIQSNFPSFLPTIGLKSIDDPLTDIATTYSILDWIRIGADDEDDTISLNFARYRNHFYDPLTGLGLNAAATGEPSPTWGLEDAQTFLTQSYSLKDARQYFYDALTLNNKDNREQLMARTFYTLGHVIHLIQDMAQPQHTRNDSHGGGVFGPPSLYEKYTDERRLDNKLPVSGFGYGVGTPPVSFPTARQFWSTAEGLGSLSGQGIANFSNRNFLSAGTNYDKLNTPGSYHRPDFYPATIANENANVLLQSVGLSPPPECDPVPCVMTFYGTAVNDAYRPGARGVNERTSI